LSVLPMATCTVACSLMIVAQVIVIIIFTSSVFILLPLQPDQFAFGTLTGSNEQIAFFSERDGNANIYVMNADGSGLTRLTDDLADDSNPSWSPDGTKIAFASAKDANLEIYLMNATDGSGQTRLTYTNAAEAEPDW
jgi:dipeptidyl aminopeptidase/acylaminoacyl peptidase